MPAARLTEIARSHNNGRVGQDGRVRLRGCNWPGLATAILIGAVAVGCYPNPNDLRTGSSGAGGDTGTNQSSLTCAQFAQTWCAQFSKCHKLDFARNFHDTNQCQDRMNGYCTTVMLGETDTGWTPSNLASCTHGWQSMACSTWNNDPSLFPGDACNPPGKRAANATCELDLQCGSRFCLYGTGDCGACAPLGGTGASCM